MNAVRSPRCLAVSSLVTAIPWVWLVGLRVSQSVCVRRMPVCALLAFLVLTIGGAVFHFARPTWFLVEWALVRTPNPSFARNTLFWEQRNFEQTGEGKGRCRVGLVGSSQTYQGFDLRQLESACPTLSFEKNCLAGFGPLQYPFLSRRIREREFDCIVCQLSEFDFFREDLVPVNRLRWAASPEGIRSLARCLTWGQFWQNRSEMGDLTLATVTPFWRLRDHFRRTIFSYWWAKNQPIEHDDGVVRLADAASLQEAIVSLRQNVGEKNLVEANFAAFLSFALAVRSGGQRLVVVEGQVHPEARKSYDAGNWHEQAAIRLRQLAQECEFLWIGSEKMPPFTEAHFADAYHLNADGRQRLTSVLAAVLNDTCPKWSTQVQSTFSP